MNCREEASSQVSLFVMLELMLVFIFFFLSNRAVDIRLLFSLTEVFQLLKYCAKCGKFHDHNFRHKDNRRKKNDEMRSFYSSRRWSELSRYIRERDNNLCQWCLVHDEFVTKNLSVHHIKKAEQFEDLRYDELNLITLCSTCHADADNGLICEDRLKEIVEKKYE